MLITALGCTEKGKRIHEHAPAKPANEQAPLENQPITGPSQNAGKTLGQLMDLVLDPKRIEDPASMVSRAVLDDLIEFNSLVLAIPEADRAKPEFAAIAHKYKTALQVGCYTEFRDSCTGLRYFKRAGNSSQVVKALAKHASDGRMRLLLYAIELKNRNWDAELVELLLATSTGRLSTSEAADLKKAQALLSHALSEGAKRIQDKTEARRYLDSMQGWALLSNPNIKLEDGARVALFELAAKADYLRGADGQLHSGLKVMMDELQSHQMSVFQRQKTLRGQRLFVPQAVGARDIGRYDEVEFLLDSVYTGQMEPQQAVVLFKSLNRGSAQLRESVENYLRIQFLATLYEGSKMAAAIFTAPVAVESLLSHALSETASINRIWHSFLAQAAPLRTFAVLATQGGNPEDQSKLRSTFDSLGRSITQVATYPHMMVLFHVLSKKRFELVLAFIGKKINSADLMRWLFEGRLPPLFPYSDDERPLNHFELIHAFDLGVRTNIFEAAGIDADDFIAEILRRQLENQSELIDTTINRVNKRMTETLNMRDLQNICAEMKGGPKAHRKYYFADMTQSPYLGKMSWQVYEGMTSQNTDTDHSSTSSGSVGRYTLGLHYADSTFNEMLETVRLDLGTSYRLGMGMMAAYKDYLVRFKLPAQGITGAEAVAEADKRTVQSRGALDRIRQQRLRVAEFAGRLYNDLGSCYTKIANHDRLLIEQLVEYEKLYLRSVHQTLVRARAPGISAQEKEQLLNSIRMTGLPGGFTGRDRLTPDGFGANQIDMMIRASRYLMHGLSLNGRTLPPLAPQLQINYGERLDLDVPVVRDAEAAFVQFVEKEDDFVASVMRLYFRNRGAFVHWKSLNTHPISSAFGLMKNLASGYRLNMELNGNPGPANAESMLKEFDDLIEYIKFSPHDRELLNTLHMRRRFDKITFDRRWIRTDDSFTRIQDTWGVYDFPLKLMASVELGFVWDMALYGEKGGAALPQRQTMFVAGKNYFESRSPVVRGYPVIPYNAVLDRELDNTVSHFVKTEMSAIRAFQDHTLGHIRLWEQRPAAERPVVDIDLDIAVRDLYTDGAVTNFRSTERLFHQQTNGFFR